MTGDTPNTHNPHDHEAAIPFVTVTSKGGPHDDASYAAGYECGLLDGRLALYSGLPATGLAFNVTARTANLPQLDLIAMRHGFTVIHSTDVEDTEGWTTLRFWQNP